MTIDLSQYVGKTITVQLGDDNFLTGQVSTNKSHKLGILYEICGYRFQRYGTSCSRANIVRILSSEKTFNGIAQKAPNINLEDFNDQVCYVKWSTGVIHLAKIWFDKDSWWNVGMTGECLVDGSVCRTKIYIEEIYGEGAYQVNTKPTFDTPNDYQIEQAKQLLSQMSEEQIAKLLKSLK